LLEVLEVLSLTHRIYMPSFIDISQAVSEPWDLKMLTRHGSTDGRSFHRFYESSQQR